MKKEKTIEVSKEVSEVFEALTGIAKATKQALADGWQMGSDIPAIVMAAYAKLPPAIEGADKIKDEFAEDKKAFAKACTDGAIEVVFSIL